MEPSNRQLCEDLMSLTQRLKGVFCGLAESFDLTPVQLSALYWIYKEGEIAMGQVAGVLHCDASNVTGLVDRLIAHDLVFRQESSRDRRIKTLRLTPKGQNVISELFAAIPARVHCDDLTPAQRRDLHGLVQVLVG